MNFLSADVPDPTDFPHDTIAPGLRALDGSLRCDICGELYDAPVTISCGHCFCSACIRVCLSNKQECPSCRKLAGEAQIRPNPILEKAISDWKNARPFILQLIKQQQATQNEDKRMYKKRKRSPERNSSADTLVPGVSSSPQKVIRATSPSSPKMVKRNSDDNVDLTISSSDIEEDEMTMINSAPKAGDLVSCPICNKKVRYQILNTHLDNGCKEVSPDSGQSAAKTWSKIMGGGKTTQHKGKHKRRDSDDEYPLSIQTYATLKDRQLKDMLQEHDLPVTGDRTNWEQRHQRWITLYNANLDRSAANRKTKSELRKDLRKWEDEMTKKKKVVIEDVIGYQIEHKTEFTNLVHAARQSNQPKAPSKSVSTNVDIDLYSPHPSHRSDQQPSNQVPVKDGVTTIIVD